MTVEEFEKHLKEKGCFYYRPNITVHYYENKVTGMSGFWGNYQGDETQDFNSLQELMEAHSWVEVPDSIEDESFPMCRKLPERDEYKIVWEGISIEIIHKPKWAAMYDHIEVKAGQPLPITETGYRSIFLPEIELTEAGGVVELVRYLLEKDAKSSDWKQYKEESRQETLF